MGKIVISENVSLDGVMEDPTGEGGFDRGGWFEQFMGEDRGAWAQAEYAEALGADALLLGRGSDAYFGARWNDATGDWPDRLNGLPKYVVSATLTEPAWRNSTVLHGDAAAEVAKLREQVAGEIVVYASRPLVQLLWERDLVDEVRLMVFPVVLGAGARVFGEFPGQKPVRLLETRTVGEGIALLRYEIVR